MKKLLSILSLFICSAVLLSGCGMGSKTESTVKSLEKPETITMTVAETLPSCAAIEDGVCFYAYDGNGRSYRVLWTDTAMVAEKDTVVVTYSELTEFTYKEYTTGWNPQYEIKATAVEVNVEYTVELTVHKSASSLPSVNFRSIYAFDDEGNNYRVDCESTEGFKDNDRIRVTYKEISEIKYEAAPPAEGVDPGPKWGAPNYRIDAVKVEKAA